MMGKTGTKEWAERTISIQRGCRNNCRYCYARFNEVHRFKRCTESEWPIPVINKKMLTRNYRHFEGLTMFPGTHDITVFNLQPCVTVLDRLLCANNKILVVSKPNIFCIKTICEHFKNYKSEIMFRFTIGSINDVVLKFWEPGAPGLKERMDCLKYAYEAGFQTSVSAEPFLDNYVHYLYEACKIWITDSFWIGKLRNFKSRVNLKNIAKENMPFVLQLTIAQTDEAIKILYEKLNGLPFIHWKDSIREIIEHG